MAKKSGEERIREYPFLTEEQQAVYEKLTQRQRAFVEHRASGYNRTAAYKMAGYDGKNATQAAYIYERDNKPVKELIAVISKNRLIRSIEKGEKTSLNAKIDILAEQQSIEDAIEKIEGADSETAKRIRFYRDIMSGATKSVKRTRKYNAQGHLVETRIEDMNDIDMRMKARRELDNILGLGSFIDIGRVSVGKITINIVDASKKDELEDSRNKVNLDIDMQETIDGENVIIVDDKEEIESENKKPSKSAEFLEKQEDE